MLRQTDLWTSGQGGYHTYRIPALAVTTRGTLLAFCEGRKSGRGDAGDIDLLLRRSRDGGKSWGNVQLLVDDGPNTAGNPAPVVDAATGTVWLLFCKNLGDGAESLIIEGKAPRTVWVTSSRDDGTTWSGPREITSSVKRPGWTWYATGPGHGLQLRSDRLLVPCDHIVGLRFQPSDPYHSHVILSDDQGATWRIGGIVPEGTNESTAVEVATGGIYINCRNYKGEKRRAFAWSRDNGEAFSDFGWDDSLVEPICQASAIRYPGPWETEPDRVLFANPASHRREKMTVRVSEDCCRSWSPGRVLHAGPSAYSDLCVGPDGSVGCLYERGDEHPYETLTFARFDLAWLMG
ncbi:MAG: exo-alpha-sialidase [Planctomycetes bacterium]|nr:exo-alpha-sialidase [Planctomycetota bacterium]